MRSRHHDSHDHQHGRHHHHHHDSLDHYHDEVEDELLYEFTQDLPLPEGTQMLADVIAALQAKGELKLSGHLVKPDDDSTFSIWHERTEDEIQKLTLEIAWYSESEQEDPEEPQVKPDIS